MSSLNKEFSSKNIIVKDNKNNDFITIEIGNTSVAIHNFKGNLVAFQNICSHRFNRIHPSGKGNKGFFCKYHGWNYDIDIINKVLDDEDISNKFNKLNFNNYDNSYLFYTNIILEPDFENKILNIKFDS